MEPNLYRDRSVMCHCINCGQKIAKIEVLAVIKIGFYICEICWKWYRDQFNQQPSKEIVL